MAWNSQNDWVKDWLEARIVALHAYHGQPWVDHVMRASCKVGTVVMARERLICCMREHIGRPARHTLASNEELYGNFPTGLPDGYEPISQTDIAHVFHMSHTGVLRILKRAESRKSHTDKSHIEQQPTP